MTTPVIHHVGLSVHDIDKSTDWYVRMFDLTVVAEFDEPAPMKVLMTDDGQAIDLRQDPAVTPGDFTQEHVGLDHIGFVCSSRDELDTWRRRLQDEGVHGVRRGRVALRLARELPRSRRDPPGVLPSGGRGRLSRYSPSGVSSPRTAVAAWNM